MTIPMIEYQTSAYKLTVDRFGNYELTRHSDGASAYFQGDDALPWQRNMKAICEVHTILDGLDESFDCLCGGYDEVLVKPPLIVTKGFGETLRNAGILGGYTVE